MADVDDGVLVQFLPVVRIELGSEEIAACHPEGIDDFSHALLVAAGKLRQFAEWHRPAHGIGDARSGYKSPEHGLDHGLQVFLCKLIEQLIGMGIERAA